MSTSYIVMHHNPGKCQKKRQCHLSFRQKSIDGKVHIKIYTGVTQFQIEAASGEGRQEMGRASLVWSSTAEQGPAFRRTLPLGVNALLLLS